MSYLPQLTSVPHLAVNTVGCVHHPSIEASAPPCVHSQELQNQNVGLEGVRRKRLLYQIMRSAHTTPPCLDSIQSWKYIASGVFFKVILKCCDLSKPEQIKPKLTSTQWCLKMYKQRQIEQTEPKMPDFNEVQMTKDKITRSDINILFTQCQDNKPCL